MVLKVRNRLKSFATVCVSTPEWSDAVGVGQKMVLKMLFLFEGLVAPVEGALELAFVALEVPV